MSVIRRKPTFVAELMATAPNHEPEACRNKNRQQDREPRTGSERLQGIGKRYREERDHMAAAVSTEIAHERDIPLSQHRASPLHAIELLRLKAKRCNVRNWAKADVALEARHLCGSTLRNVTPLRMCVRARLYSAVSKNVAAVARAGCVGQPRARASAFQAL